MSKSNAFTMGVDLQHFAFETETTFRGLTISQKEDGWNIVVRATDKNGSQIYAIVQHEDINVGLAELASALASKDAHYFWRLDTWAKR